MRIARYKLADWRINDEGYAMRLMTPIGSKVMPHSIFAADEGNVGIGISFLEEPAAMVKAEAPVTDRTRFRSAGQHAFFAVRNGSTIQPHWVHLGVVYASLFPTHREEWFDIFYAQA